MLPIDVAPLAGLWSGIVSMPTTVRSCPLRTNVPSEVLLFADVGSAVSDDTDAVLVMAPAAPILTSVTMVTVAVPPLARLPTLHVTTPAECPQIPESDDAETNVTAAGRLSVATTFVAVDGPLLWAIKV
jgi:hypothetical protein